jgi:hypothetical protein
MLAQWIAGVTFTDQLPVLPLERIALEGEVPDFSPSARQFAKNWTFTRRLLSDVLRGSFGRSDSGHKRYPSAGALYPVMPLLCVLSPTAVEDLTPGAFAFDSRAPGLLRLTEWSSEVLEDIKMLASPFGVAPSDTLIAYSIDVRRAVTKYRYKGYRHGLIEIGLMAQAFREALRDVDGGNGLGERCWSAFADNAFTAACGLNVRLAPISLLQWFGKMDDELK